MADFITAIVGREISMLWDLGVSKSIINQSYLKKLHIEKRTL